MSIDTVADAIIGNMQDEIATLEAKVERLLARIPDPDDLRLVLGSMGNVVSICRALKDANAKRLVKAHDNVRATLEELAVDYIAKQKVPDS